MQTIHTRWSEFKSAAIEYKKGIERDLMLRRYHYWSQGLIPWEDRVLDYFAKTKVFVIASWRSIIKRLMDIALSLIGLIVFLPVMILIAIAIKFSSRGHVFYTQTRVGLRGKHFQMLKFRTMHRDAESATGPVWAATHDPRITRVGRFLRAAHLDELPQLFNVLMGSMSIVGPRPERPHFVTEFRKLIPRYERRLCAKPGITGLAQIKRRYDESLEDVKRKVRYDALYIQKMCPLLDVKVIALTIGTVVFRTGR